MLQNTHTNRQTPVAIVDCHHRGLGLSYLRAGDHGPAVVFLHGWGAFKELWWSTLRDLGRDHRCFAVDVPGHGSSPIGSVQSLAEVAAQVAAFCDQLGLDGITLVGHSMGGSVAVELALAYPRLVRRLVLVDAAVDAYRMPAYSRTYLRRPLGLGWASLRVAQLLGRTFMEPLGRQVPHEHGGGWIRPWFRRAVYLSNGDPEALHRIYRSLFATQAGERLAAIGAPTLVINGQLDQLVTPAHARRTAAAIPGARYVEIPGAVHNPMDERPRAFIRALRLFLEHAPQ